MGNALTSYAKRECANWEFERCIMRLSGICHLDENTPCPWFEKCLIPDVKYEPNAHKILELYGKINPEYKPQTTRNCECGNKLLPGERYCTSCRIKRRRNTYKRSKQKSRKQEAA